MRGAERGHHIPALDEMPILSAQERFYLQSYDVLQYAGYADISAYFRDYGFSHIERRDFLTILTVLNKLKAGSENANSRTSIRRQRRVSRGA